jgi:hypothetical protein
MAREKRAASGYDESFSVCCLLAFAETERIQFLMENDGRWADGSYVNASRAFYLEGGEECFLSSYKLLTFRFIIFLLASRALLMFL